MGLGGCARGVLSVIVSDGCQLHVIRDKDRRG